MRLTRACFWQGGRFKACREAMQVLILPGRQLFICDTHVNRDPDAEQIAEMTLLAAVADAGAVREKLPCALHYSAKM